MKRPQEDEDAIEAEQLMGDDIDVDIDVEVASPQRGRAPPVSRGALPFQLNLFTHCFYVFVCMCSFTVFLPSMWGYINEVCFSS